MCCERVLLLEDLSLAPQKFTLSWSLWHHIPFVLQAGIFQEFFLSLLICSLCIPQDQTQSGSSWLSHFSPACVTYSVQGTLTFHLSLRHTKSTSISGPKDIISFASKDLYPDFYMGVSYSAFKSSIMSSWRIFLATIAKAISATTVSSPPILFSPWLQFLHSPYHQYLKSFYLCRDFFPGSFSLALIKCSLNTCLTNRQSQ